MRPGALRIALIYLLVSLAWIVFSDHMLSVYQHLLSGWAFNIFSNSRRFVFVIVTSFLIYRLVVIDEKKLFKSEREARRRDNEVKRLGRIITKVNNIIIITDKNNFVTWVNQAFVDFTGYKLDEVAGYAAATFFAGEETDMEILSAIQKRKIALESFSVEVQCHKKDGQKFWVHGEYTPLFDDNNEHTGYIAVYNDITETKQKEQEITRQNEKLKEIAWLSSHEIRRPLANIIGLANMMKVSPLMEEKIRILDNVNKSAEELDQIVHAINSKIGDQVKNMHQPDEQLVKTPGRA
ncbi:MAG TPA: PAS domain S-box protein [Mucilaginibacter sp.]|nr:PAS domain S-box protein [Mucilaginibacter sp.]